MDEMFVRAFLKALILPPFVNILVLVAALLLLRRWKVLRALLAAASLGSLVLLSMPIVSQLLASQLERYPALQWQAINPEDYQAIVVLGAGRYRQALEYGGEDIPKHLGLERLRYAAYLQRKTGLPILVSGGMWSDDSDPEAEFMARILEGEFRGRVPWREGISRTTWENAVYSRQIAEKNGIDKVLLVTHAWHMPRAVYSFEKAGFKVTPAPTVFKSVDLPGIGVMDFVPGINALYNSTWMLHEMLGLLWYRISSD
jgi:uncharacterized SAM-binding protein YcdF (DUF218 family)